MPQSRQQKRGLVNHRSPDNSRPINPDEPWRRNTEFLPGWVKGFIYSQALIHACPLQEQLHIMAQLPARIPGKPAKVVCRDPGGSRQLCREGLPPPRTREDSGVLGARCGKEEGSGRPGSRRGAWEAGVSRGRGALSARDQERAGKRSGVRPWGPWLCGRQGKAETGSMQRGRTNGHGRPGPLLGGIQPEKQPPSRPLPAPAQGPMQELGVDTPGQPWLSGG